MKYWGANFKLNTTVSSVGAVVMVFGSLWGWFAYMSKPEYERTTKSIMERVAESPPELARPIPGKFVTAADGSRLKVESVYGITSIGQHGESSDHLEKSLRGYAEYVRSKPNSAVVFNVGAKDDEKTRALAVKFVESLKASGLTPNEIVVTPPEPAQWKQSAESTISVIDGQPSNGRP